MNEYSNHRPGTRVSLFFDGLMISCFTKDNRCQTGIYTRPENQDHRFEVVVYDVRNFRKGAIAYKRLTCDEIKKAAPLWLYVDTGNGRQKDIYSAARFEPSDQSDPRSFNRVLDFDGQELHGPPDDEVTIIPGALSVLNVLQGLFYAAKLDDFQRRVIKPADKGLTGLEPLVLLKKATLVGAQINLPEQDHLQLKLEDSFGNNLLLPVPLEAGVQYVAYIEFAPEPVGSEHEHESKPAHECIHLPESHFERFYQALDPKSKIQFDIIGLESAAEVRSLPYNPPCSVPTLSKHYSLEN